MTVIIKNKKTGFAMECSNLDVIKICKADVENYEVTEVNATTSKKSTPKKATTK